MGGAQWVGLESGEGGARIRGGGAHNVVCGLVGGTFYDI